MSNRHVLDAFLPPVRQWFRESFGEPTAPQARGWPAIQRGDHTLILAPTGSGKTLSAFLCGIDQLFREPDPEQIAGIRLLYISPLKALNNDIERNLRVPLEGIRTVAEHMKLTLPALRVAVRTGDTPANTRQQIWKRPPQILITTPESLYLMLTSPRARDIFRTVRTVIVDEIHTLCGDKRGVHLSLSLERLDAIAATAVQRIGLSATIKPLDEVARFLGGQEMLDETVRERRVTIVDTGYRKAMDLQVITAVEDFNALPGGTIWPSLVPSVLKDILTHRSTLIFANNRRLAERTADRLNAQFEAEQSEEFPPGSTEALAPGGVPRDGGLFTIGASGPFRAHHGSMSKEARREMEEDLKAGKLPALVGTSSLELGIDIGAVDLVVQLQSPKSVAQGLQRVGRSGHLVGQTSVGRIYATFKEDLVEAAALARAMLDGDVEQTATPQTPLDVLAQQIVAMVSVEDWAAEELYTLVRRAYAYRELSRKTFDLVLEMLSGKYQAGGIASAGLGQALRARIGWDRVNARLSALPGARLLALSNAGTIADRGAFGVYLGDGKTKIGELDEEFVFETRAGNTFLLGSQTWRVLDIQDDRVIVGDATGAMVRMPFWRGDYPWRTYSLGVRIGRFRRELAERIRAAQPGDMTVDEWLRRDYRLDDNSVRNLVAHVQAQLNATGVMSNDRQIVLEVCEDALGARIWVVHSPFGGRVNGAWALALASALYDQTGVEPEVQTDDDGILFRFASVAQDPPVDLVRKLTAEQARERILAGLPDSALFGAHFRMNAGRALLLPRARGSKRTPFWLQRLKAKDLLAIVRRFDDFPIIAETYRDCLRDVLDLPHLEDVLRAIESGEIGVVQVESLTPSPIAASLLANFAGVYMYEWDAPKAERQLQALSLRRDVLEELLGAGGSALSELLKPAAIREVRERSQHVDPNYRARSAEELAQILYELGDLTTNEAIARSTGDAAKWLVQLAGERRCSQVEIPTTASAEARWIHAELGDEYREALSGSLTAIQSIVGRLLRQAGPLTDAAIRTRYAFDERAMAAALDALVATGEVVAGHFTQGISADEYCERGYLERIHQRTLSLLRKEVQPVPVAAYADFLLRWQHIAQNERFGEPDAMRTIMQQLRGVSLIATVWERDVLPARMRSYSADALAELTSVGDLIWVATGRTARAANVRFLFRGEGNLFLDEAAQSELSGAALTVYKFLQAEGASFGTDIEAATGLGQPAVMDALVELALGSLVTNDSLDTLRAMLDYERGAARPVANLLEVELAARRMQPPRLTATRYRDAKRKVRARLEPEAHAMPSFEGRWSLVRRTVIMGKPISENERAARLARLLLDRYGIVSRERLAHEELPVVWALLYPQLERMEMRGEARRGYFVAGLSGVQFALPEAIERLRTSVESSGADGPTVVSALDPANIYGAATATLEPTVDNAVRFARVPSTHVLIDDGRPILVAEDYGTRLTIAEDAGHERIETALRAYLTRPSAPRQMVVEQWNAEPVSLVNGEPLLSRLGFTRTPRGMEHWSF